jgi:hypothetical protein
VSASEKGQDESDGEGESGEGEIGEGAGGKRGTKKRGQQTGTGPKKKRVEKVGKEPLLELSSISVSRRANVDEESPVSAGAGKKKMHCQEGAASEAAGVAATAQVGEGSVAVHNSADLLKDWQSQSTVSESDKSSPTSLRTAIFAAFDALMTCMGGPDSQMIAIAARSVTLLVKEVAERGLSLGVVLPDASKICECYCTFVGKKMSSLGFREALLDQRDCVVRVFDELQAIGLHGEERQQQERREEERQQQQRDIEQQLKRQEDERRRAQIAAVSSASQAVSLDQNGRVAWFKMRLAKLQKGRHSIPRSGRRK